MSDPRPHVLVVDDEEDFCELIALRLEHHGFRVTTCRTLQGALAVIDRERVDSVVLDLRLENEDGMELFGEVRRRGLQLPVMILTADGAGVAPLRLAGAEPALMPKPFDTRQLVLWLTRAVDRQRAAAAARTV